MSPKHENRKEFALRGPEYIVLVLVESQNIDRKGTERVGEKNVQDTAQEEATHSPGLTGNGHAKVPAQGLDRLRGGSRAARRSTAWLPTRREL